MAENTTESSSEQEEHQCLSRHEAEQFIATARKIFQAMDKPTVTEPKIYIMELPDGEQIIEQIHLIRFAQPTVQETEEGLDERGHQGGSG